MKILKKFILIRVAKGRKISGTFPWELSLGNFGTYQEFMGIIWKYREIYQTIIYNHKYKHFILS